MPSRAIDAQERVASRVLAALRLLSLVVLVVYVVIWDDWYLAAAGRLAGVGGAAVWDLIFVVACLRGRVTNWLAAGDFSTAVLLGLGAPLWVPPEALGDGGSWVYRALVGAGVVAAWQVPAVLRGLRPPGAWSDDGRVPFGRVLVFPAVVTVLALVHFTSAPDAMPQVLASTILLVSLASVLRFAITRLRRNARMADARLDTAAARLRAEAVTDARWRDRRERERILHDTVLNTLTGIGWGGGTDDDLTRTRCARSVDAVEALIGGGDSGGWVDLGARIDQVVTDARNCGLEVGLSVQQDSGQCPPGEVVVALTAAAGEALINVARHAGTGTATIAVQGRTDYLSITVSDQGVGFDLDRVDGRGLGLRASIKDRVADVGGSVRIDTEPGCGTTIGMIWAAQSAAGAMADAGMDLRQHYETGLRRMVTLSVACWQALLVLPLIGFWREVTEPLVSVGLWIGTAVGVALAGRVMWHRPLSRFEAGGVSVIALAAVGLGGLNITGGDAVRLVNWPATMALPALVLMVGVSRPRWEWLPTCSAATAMIITFVMLKSGTGPVVLSRLVTSLFGLWSLQALATAFGPVLQSTAEATATAVRDEAELVARREAAARIRADRSRGLHGLERETLPLLRAIAGRELDPQDPSVRARCAHRASVLRRMLAATAEPAVSLGALGTVVEAAEARGIAVELQLDGDLRRCPDDVLAELVEAVGQLLRSVAAGRVLLTILAAPDQGSVFVSFPAVAGTPARAPWPRDPGRLEVSADVTDGQACVELRYGSPS